jgi:OOP family OmpA-OmpF porin
MKKYRNFALALTVATVLSGCSVADSYSELKTLNETEAVGSPFTQALAGEYREFANQQFDSGFDYPDSLHFARKGLAAAAGNAVLPEPVMDWSLAEGHLHELSAARGRIILAYDRGGREAAPELAAKVQAKYDCWIEYQEENWNNDSEIACKSEFMDLIQQLEAALPPPQVKEVPQAAAPDVFDIDPSQPMAAENAMYLIFFDWDSSKVGSGALSVLDAVAQEAAKISPQTVNVVGHADTSGPTDYNQRLALKRAKAAKEELTARGIDAATIMVDAKGETDLLVPTPDDVREPANRRVNISFQ